MKSVVINVYGDRRIVVNATGGYDLEALVDGIGWVLDNDPCDSVVEWKWAANKTGRIIKEQQTMNTNITIISSEEEDFNLENIKPLDLQELAKEALELNHEVHVSTFHDDKFGFGTVVITPNRAGICWNGNSVFGDWITPSNGEGYLLTEDGDKYDINGNHLGNEELCENCQQSNKLTLATGTRFWKKAFGNTEDRDVHLCNECVVISDDYESL